MTSRHVIDTPADWAVVARRRPGLCRGTLSRRPYDSQGVSLVGRGRRERLRLLMDA
jgi:hypothetical protein